MPPRLVLPLFGPIRSSNAAEFPCDECVAWASPTFQAWTGAPPGSDYGGKPIIEFRGEPAFAELAIVHALRASGWSAVWATQAGGRLKFRDAFWGMPRPPLVPASVVSALAEAAAHRGGSYRGTWDVVAWPVGTSEPKLPDLRFVEAKHRGRDRIHLEQVGWYQLMRARGASREQFLVVEWKLSEEAADAHHAWGWT